MRLVFTVFLFVLATSARAGPAADIGRLAWMAGAWIEETPKATTRETWLPPLDGAMAGAGQTNVAGRPPRIEHMTITVEPAGVTFTAFVPGQPPTPFVLRPGPDGEAVFENPAHDFPQRVIYRRCGDQLCARIEGLRRGTPTAKSWTYRRLR